MCDLGIDGFVINYFFRAIVKVLRQIKGATLPLAGQFCAGLSLSTRSYYCCCSSF